MQGLNLCSEGFDRGFLLGYGYEDLMNWGI